jgi:hypothetical protein
VGSLQVSLPRACGCLEAVGNVETVKRPFPNPIPRQAPAVPLFSRRAGQGTKAVARHARVFCLGTNESNPAILGKYKRLLLALAYSPVIMSCEELTQGTHHGSDDEAASRGQG